MSKPKKAPKAVPVPPAPVISKIPIEVSDSPLVIDLPDGQKLVVGKMIQGTVIEVATWRGTGRPDSRTSRLMLGMSIEDVAPKSAAKVDPEESVTNADGSVSAAPAKPKSFTQEWLEYIAIKVPKLSFLAKIKVPAIKIPSLASLNSLTKSSPKTKSPKAPKAPKAAKTLKARKANSLISGEKKSLPAIAPDTESAEIAAWLDQITEKARNQSATEVEAKVSTKPSLPSPFDPPALRSSANKKSAQKSSKSPKNRK